MGLISAVQLTDCRSAYQITRCKRDIWGSLSPDVEKDLWRDLWGSLWTGVYKLPQRSVYLMRCQVQVFPYVLIERVFIHDHRSALYTTGLMTKRTVYDTVNSTKKDKRSGKERLCCRHMQTEWITHIACLIFREQLCLPPKKRHGLLMYAFLRPDQVDVWDRVPPREPWNNQTDYSD